MSHLDPSPKRIRAAIQWQMLRAEPNVRPRRVDRRVRARDEQRDEVVHWRGLEPPPNATTMESASSAAAPPRARGARQGVAMQCSPRARRPDAHDVMDRARGAHAALAGRAWSRSVTSARERRNKRGRADANIVEPCCFFFACNTRGLSPYTLARCAATNARTMQTAAARLWCLSHGTRTASNNDGQPART
jgi:hypothetical protein